MFVGKSDHRHRRLPQCRYFYYVNGGYHVGNNGIVCYAIPDQFCRALFPTTRSAKRWNPHGQLDQCHLGNLGIHRTMGIALPFWFIGIGMIISFVAAAYLNQRVFSYDALAEHANPEELKTLLKTDKLMLWGLGLLTGVLQFVPILNFFAPTITALAFIHLELTRLKKLRAQSNHPPQIG